MPCGDGGNSSPSYRGEYEVERQRARAATRAACELARHLRTYDLLEGIVSQETLNWVLEHDKEDKARIAREEAEKARKRKRKAALAKLTAAEAELLGIR